MQGMPRSKSAKSQSVPRPGKPSTAKNKRGDWLAATIGGRISEARKNAGFDTIASVHKATVQVDNDEQGISQPVLKGYEDGKFKPGARELRILSLALSVSPNWLLFGAEEAPKAFAGEQPSSRISALTSISTDEQRLVLISLFLMQLQKTEREALFTLLEAMLKARLGKNQFEMLFEVFEGVTRTIAAPGSQLLKMTGDLIESETAKPELEKLSKELEKSAVKRGLKTPKAK